MPQPQCRRPLSQLAGLPLAALLLLGSGNAALAQGQGSATNGSGSPAAAEALSVDQARAAADRILRAVQSRDARLRYSQFSDELKAVSSPAMVESTLKRQPRLLSWTLLSVRGGLQSTTVEVSARTAAGPRDLFLVLNNRGQLTGYHVDLTDEKASRVAGDFVRALSTGHYITARSFLSLPMQAELGPDTLQAKWLGLQRLTGNFLRVNRVVEADKSGDTQLVLVNAEFNRVTDNLFVILNANNEIVGVDFPQDPALSR